MNKLVTSLLQEITNTTGKYEVQNTSVNAEIELWRRKAQSNKKNGIPFKATLKDARLYFKDAEITIKAEHAPEIERVEAELAKIREDLAHAHEHYEQYVHMEKETLPDKMYERIDRLHARQQRLQARIAEQQEFHSLQNPTDHEGSKK